MLANSAAKGVSGGCVPLASGAASVSTEEVVNGDLGSSHIGVSVLVIVVGLEVVGE